MKTLCAVSLLLGLASLRLWHDEVLIRRQRDTNILQHRWNQMVKQDDDRLRTSYQIMWKDQQKCHPMLGAEGRDVFCHHDQCMFLEPIRFPEPRELYMGNLDGENIWTYEQP